MDPPGQERGLGLRARAWGLFCSLNSTFDQNQHWGKRRCDHPCWGRIRLQGRRAGRHRMGVEVVGLVGGSLGTGGERAWSQKPAEPL